MKTVDIEWVATWSCPKCGEPTDSNEVDVDFSDRTEKIVCSEQVDKGGCDFEECGHTYKIRR